MEDRWCILRTGGARTLALAESLNAAGFRAWTPTEVIKRRKPGGRSGKVETVVAMMPTFVFASAQHIHELLRIRIAPASNHPAFSIFKHEGRVPLVSSLEMERLRLAERRAAPKDRRRTFDIGQGVRTTEGGFAGLTGVVEGTSGKYTLVSFGGSLSVKISTFMLIDDGVWNVSNIAA